MSTDSFERRERVSEYERQVKRNAKRLAALCAEGEENLSAQRKKVRELEKRNARLGAELKLLRSANARHLNKIQSLALERDRYIAVIEVLKVPEVGG